jgi:hypothetical protein
LINPLDAVMLIDNPEGITVGDSPIENNSLTGFNREALTI